MRIVHRGPIQLVAYYFEWSSHPLHQQGRESIFGMIGMRFACYLLNVILCVASGVYCHRLLKWIFCGVHFFWGVFLRCHQNKIERRKNKSTKCVHEFYAQDRPIGAFVDFVHFVHQKCRQIRVSHKIG